MAEQTHYRPQLIFRLSDQFNQISSDSTLLLLLL